MTTKVSIPLRRELEIDGQPYTVTITTVGLKVVRKGYRIGSYVPWARFIADQCSFRVDDATERKTTP